MIECRWKSTYGIDCIGCGFQSALKLLFEGDFVGSFIMYPALIPIIFTFLYVALHLKFKFKNGARYILILFSSSVAMMLISYFYKLLL
jgi:hypothetical protein